jgi:hypothetical protein
MTMPDNSERKRLKKKMLDRWENEGGRITADPLIANESNPASQRKGKNSQGPASNNSSRADRVSSRKTRRKLTQK